MQQSVRELFSARCSTIRLRGIANPQSSSKPSNSTCTSIDALYRRRRGVTPTLRSILQNFDFLHGYMAPFDFYLLLFCSCCKSKHYSPTHERAALGGVAKLLNIDRIFTPRRRRRQCSDFVTIPLYSK